MKPQRLKPRRELYQESVVSELEDARKVAKEVGAVGVVVLIQAPGGVTHRMTAYENCDGILGSLAQAMHDIASRRP